MTSNCVAFDVMRSVARLVPVAVVLELVVAAECDHRTESDRVREEDLCAGIEPNL